MPFVGLDCGDFTLTYIFTNPFNNQLEFQPSPDRRLQARYTHRFTPNHAVKEYGVTIRLGKNSPVEPASLYRKWLLQRGEFVSFKEKIQPAPQAAKLAGVASTVHFAHGVMTPVIGWGDPDLADAKSKYYTGGYY